MNNTVDNLQQWLADIATLMEANAEPEPQHFAAFLHEPALGLRIIELIDSFAEEAMDDERSYYSPCLFALDICIAQLRSASETHNKQSQKTLNQLMSHLATLIFNTQHSLSYWLPVLNAFYDAHLELSPELQDAYMNLANEDFENSDDENMDHLGAIREVIAELSDLSTFDIAENFFAQSYAMPPDFFIDLMIDLYSLEEAQDIALLSLLHPNLEVRELVRLAFDQIVNNVTLSPLSLSRLQAIKHLYPESYHEQFERWLKVQRLHGAVYEKIQPAATIIKIRASEIDGSGAQGLFIQIKQGRKQRLCGLLFKYEYGIKDAWLTPPLTTAEISQYYEEAFDDSVAIREVDIDYLKLMTEHFLALTIKNNDIPDLHFLEIQELLGLRLTPNPLDIDAMLEALSIEISPFVQERMDSALKKTTTWMRDKSFTESWFIENSTIDKLVNRYCTITDGMKICDVQPAIFAVVNQEMEKHRDRWLFHFLWVSLWLKSKARKNEKVWQECFFLCYAIHQNISLEQIPIMHEIAEHTVYHSIDTMNERKTYLSEE